jgi:hypothetical protein
MQFHVAHVTELSEYGPSKSVNRLHL